MKGCRMNDDDIESVFLQKFLELTEKEKQLVVEYMGHLLYTEHGITS